MKKYASLLLSLALLGCNDPKSLVLPQDITAAGNDKEFVEQVKTLPQEDKDLLTGYLARSAISQAITKEPGKVGVTVGEAIDNQRAWLKEQEAIKLAEKEAQAKALAELEKQNALIRQSLQVVFVKLGTLTKENYSTYLPVYVNLKNTSGKEIAGFKAHIDFQDQFGEVFKSVSIEESQTMPVGYDNTVRYYFSYNQFDDGWQKLVSLEEGKFSGSGQATHLIFPDGQQLKSQ